MNMNKYNKISLLLIVFSLFFVSKNVYATTGGCGVLNGLSYNESSIKSCEERSSINHKMCKASKNNLAGTLSCEEGTECESGYNLVDGKCVEGTNQTNSNLTNSESNSGSSSNSSKKIISESCTSIKKSSECSNTIAKGYNCIWRQGSCFNGTKVESNSSSSSSSNSSDNSTNSNSSDSNSSSSSSNSNSEISISSGDGELNVSSCSSITKKELCGTRDGCQWNSGKCQELYVADNPCSENSIKMTLRFFGYLLLIAKILIPFIIISFATFDLFKAVTDKDEQSLQKQIKQVIIRIIAGLIVFFIPSIVSAAFSISDRLNLMNEAKYKTCINCLLKPTSNTCTITNEQVTEDSTTKQTQTTQSTTHISSSGETYGGIGGSY